MTPFRMSSRISRRKVKPSHTKKIMIMINTKIGGQKGIIAKKLL